MSSIDFDATRVKDLFKDESMKELKEGITTRDINSVAGMTPKNRTDLQKMIQDAYNLVYNVSQNELSRTGGQKRTLMEQIKEQSQNPTQQEKPKTLAEQIEAQKNQQTASQPTSADAIMEMYNKMKSTSSNPVPSLQLDTSNVSAWENQIKEKDALIESLKKEVEDAINKQYELENYHKNKYKELNDKYEDLKEKKEVSVIGEMSEDLIEYLKDKIMREEQKNDLLHQELGRLKGLLGI